MKRPKQIIIVRKDLKMRKGKIAAQAAHASFKVFLDLGTRYENPQTLERSIDFYYEANSAWDLWLNGLFTKVVVSCDSENELDELYMLAKSKKLPCSMIVDAGLTEFHNVPTKTCIAIGPCFEEDLEFTKHLQLL